MLLLNTYRCTWLLSLRPWDFRDGRDIALTDCIQVLDRWQEDILTDKTSLAGPGQHSQSNYYFVQ